MKPNFTDFRSLFMMFMVRRSGHSAQPPTPALARCGSHMGNTALELGISRKNLWEKMRKLGLRGEADEDA